jgi:phosphatidylinositol alpha-1,6-mannosyltransferase
MTLDLHAGEAQAQIARRHTHDVRDVTIPRTLVLTGHFPPECGGIQTFTWEFVRRLPSDRVVVVAPAWPGATEFDASLNFPVVRRHGYLLFRHLPELVRRFDLEVGWVTALAPFGLYLPFLRAAGLRRVVASSHGQEIGWTRSWPTKLALRRMAGGMDAVTYLSAMTRQRLTDVIQGTSMFQLAGGVDTERFVADGSRRRAVRQRYGLGDAPVVVSVSRLVRRKGHDVLLEAWPVIRAAVPDARLIIVGEGPMLEPLRSLAARRFATSVIVTGPLPADELPGIYAAADLFVLPCRDDRGGRQTEGLGLSTLEASASGLPVVVGRSGGSAAAVRVGETGEIVDARRPGALAPVITELLLDPTKARRMGTAGRRWAAQEWSWDRATQRLAAVLSDGASG